MSIEDHNLPQSRFGFWSFIVFMLVLTGLFAGLGYWQLERLKEKEALIASVEARQHLPALTLPGLAEWVGIDPEVYNFQPLTVSGHFAPGSVLVFTSLSDPKGTYSGPGYWVMTPFVTDQGGAIFVNRGFIPQQSAGEFAKNALLSTAPTQLTGLALRPEAAGPFTPGPDGANHIEWIRDPKRLAALSDPALGPFAPITLDLPAGEKGALPQGGETMIEFPNNHLGYALTWFGFALLTPALLIAWVIRQKKRKTPQKLAARGSFQ